MLDNLITQFVLLWAVIDPIGSVTVYMAQTHHLELKQRRAVAGSAAARACIGERNVVNQALRRRRKSKPRVAAMSEAAAGSGTGVIMSCRVLLTRFITSSGW